MNMAAHPLLTRQYILPTPQLNLLLATVVDWVMLSKPGGMIYGRYRVGKTWASLYLQAELPEYFPSMPIFSIPERTNPGKGEKDFFKYCLSACNYALASNSGSTGDFRNRLTDYLVQQVTKSQQPRLVLFFDEAQRMEVIQLQWLVDVFNELSKQQVSPSFILLGQPQLLSRRASLAREEQRQIIARFMSNEFALKGLSYDDFAEVIAVYDDGENLSYPNGSGISFTEYFVPKRYATGWRLKHIANDLANSFRTLLREKKLPDVTAVPMEFFTQSIAALLLDLHESDNDVYVAVATEHLNNAVEHSGFLNYVAHTSAQKSEARKQDK